MRQTVIQNGRQKERVGTSKLHKLQDFFHKIEKTLSRVFKMSSTIIFAGMIVFIAYKGLAPRKVAYAGEEKGGYTQEVKKKVVIDKLYKLETGTVEELVEKMKKEGFNPKVISETAGNGAVVSVMADNYSHIYIYGTNSQNAIKPKLIGIITIPDVNPYQPLKFHYAKIMIFKEAYIITNGNNPELIRVTKADGSQKIEKIPLSPEIQLILNEVGDINNLRGISYVFSYKDGTEKYFTFSYVLGFDANGNPSGNVLVIRDDGAKRLFTLDVVTSEEIMGVWRLKQEDIYSIRPKPLKTSSTYGTQTTTQAK